MKQLTTICCLLLAGWISVSAQVKNNGCYFRLVEPIQSDTLLYETEQLTISFGFSSSSFVALYIQNKSDDLIEINWDKFVMIIEGKSYPIIFDDTIMAFKNQPKGCNAIAPKSRIYKKISVAEYIDLGLSLYTKGRIKKYGNQRMGFIVPIVSNGETVNYNCTVEISQ